MHRTATADDKKLQFSLKKLGVNNISGIEEVGLIFSFHSVPAIHFYFSVVKSLISYRLTCLQIKEQ